jgi:8-amino-7-oxononanoate synthase
MRLQSLLPDGLEQRLLDRLARLETNGLRRRLLPASGFDFCSNDYLGLAHHPLLKEKLIEAVEREGCGATGSRLIRGDNHSFAEVEQRFAAFKGTDRSLYFSSGYLANLAVLTTFLDQEDVVFSDSLNHASLIDGVRLSKARCLIFPHRDIESLRSLIQSKRGTGQRFLLTESLFSMDGDEAPLAAYASLCRETGTALIVDEAHAIGVYGPKGSGLIEACGIDVFLSINSAGKALGVAGAFVAGPALAIDYLIQKARPFIFSTAPPPALAAAIDAALTLVTTVPEKRSRVHANAELLRQTLVENEVKVAPGNSQILPLIIGDNSLALSVAESLRQEGFDVRAIRPPTVPHGSARLRITVNSTLDEPVLRAFASSLRRALDQETKTCKASS